MKVLKRVLEFRVHFHTSLTQTKTGKYISAKYECGVIIWLRKALAQDEEELWTPHPLLGHYYPTYKEPSILNFIIILKIWEPSILIDS